MTVMVAMQSIPVIDWKSATPDVTWESTYQYNIGLDTSVLDGRLSFTAEWFRKDTKDLLLRKPAPQYNGGGSSGSTKVKLETLVLNLPSQQLL